MNYIAHFNDEKEIQTVKEHSENVAALSESFSNYLKSVAAISGLYHDVGKYGKEWQNHIINGKGNVIHAVYGALEVKNMQSQPEYPDECLSRMIQYIITGHHCGIPDGGSNLEQSTLQYQMENAPAMDYSAYMYDLPIKKISADEERAYLKELIANNNGNKDGVIDNYAFDTRMQFSCMTDADSLDTKMFCNPVTSTSDITPARGTLKNDFVAALQSLNTYISKFRQQTELQKARTRLQNQVYENIKNPAEINLINLPMGSGKTICSVKAGIELLLKYQKKRIIYVIPYNSITDQTANEFKNIFGNDVSILRHQSTYNLKDEESEDEELPTKLDAIENWDAPFIITTSAQFFESVYADKRKKARKIHNMADSILIFDEVHKLPDEILQPCLEVISYLTKSYNSIALLLSATMPNMEQLIHKLGLPNSTIKDLVPDKTDFVWFSKCKYEYLPAQAQNSEDSVSTNENSIINKMLESASALMIVNKKKTARMMYHMLCNSGCQVYHLSTYQTPEDRLQIILEIKEKLKSLIKQYPNLQNVPKEERIMVVSTSLIEAGVDLDFETVYREITGLDSILQAGGRCNREGLRQYGMVYVFDLEDTQETISSNITRHLFKIKTDVSTQESIKEYFEKYYASVGNKVSNRSIHNYVNSKNRDFYNYIPFREYTKDIFKYIIDSYGESIVIPRNEKSRQLIQDVLTKKLLNMKALQKYTVQVSAKEHEYLSSLGVIEDNNTGVWCLTDDSYYEKGTGIKTF